MSGIAFEIKTQPSDGRSDSSGTMFLCHNSKDKPAVKRIVNALELEFGTRFFLDAYAIPTGEAFLPWIERSLTEATGVAIFLGANGWGPTHLWEAERALTRYRGNSSFRIIPVALPGIAPEDMRRLGAGKVFQEINWADFTGELEDRDSIGKLAASLSGRALPQHRGPARLTPYQIRRDAERWARSGGNDRSILYTGAQLKDAARLIRENPDYVVVDEVMPFLDAAQEGQNRFWRRVALGGVTTAFALALLTAVAVFASWLAEQRRLSSLSRQLAIVSRDAASADRRLLTAAQAVHMDATAEAKGALLGRLREARHLTRIVYGDTGVEALAFDPTRGSALVGTWDGRLRHIADGSAVLHDIPSGTALPAAGAVTALATHDGQVWLGRETGRVDAVAGPEAARTVLAPVAQVPPSRDLGIRALAKQTGGPFLAAGTGSGRLAVVDTRDGTVSLDLDEGDDVRVTAAAFDHSGRWLAAGTGHGQILLVSTSDLVVRQRYPKIDGGVLALGFSQRGDLLVVGSHGHLMTFKWRNAEFRRTGTYSLPALLTSATFDHEGRRVAVGDGSGAVYLYDPLGQSLDLGETRAHANRVSALAFGADGDTLVSGASDGTVALWDLKGRSGPSAPVTAFGPDASRLRTRPDGTLVAAYSLLGRAGVWRLEGKVWAQEVDLLEATRAALGDGGLGEPDGERGAAPGFKSMDEEIPAVVLSADGTRVAWLTRRGALLWQDLPSRSGPVVEDAGRGRRRGELAMSADGRVLAFVDHDARDAAVMDLSRRGEPARAIALPAAGRSLALDASGGQLVVGLEDGHALAFRADLGWRAAGAAVKLHEAAVAGISFSSGGERLISFGSGGGGADRTIVVAASSSLAPLRRLQSRQAGGSVSATATGVRSGLLAAADQDGQVLLWSLSDLRFIAELKAGSTVVPTLHIDDDRRRLYAYSSDGSFTSWALDPDAWMALACAKANRTFRADEWAELLPDDAYRPACELRSPGAVNVGGGAALPRSDRGAAVSASGDRDHDAASGRHGDGSFHGR